MVRVKVRILEPLLEISKFDNEYKYGKEIVTKEGASLADLLEELVQKHGQMLDKAIFDSNPRELKSHIMILLNNHLAVHKDGFKIVLNDGDVVVVAIAFSGG